MLLAGDTRASTEVLAEWVGGAFVAAGGELHWAGVLPTPAVSHLVREHGGFGAGVVVSASHNPAADNGVKLVSRAGTKWPVDEERRLEERLAALAGDAPAAPLPAPDATLAGAVPRVAPGVAAAAVARRDADRGRCGERSGVAGRAPVLRRARRRGRPHPCRTGRPQHQRPLRRALPGAARGGGAPPPRRRRGGARRRRRPLRSSSRAPGRVLDGDDALLVWARALAATGRLPGAKVVATVMSNLGLEAALRREAIALVRCPVGDREVWETMQREGAALGGEQSGHVICGHLAVTGDGLLTAAHLLAVAHRRSTSRLSPTWSASRRCSSTSGWRRAVPVDEVPELAAAVRAAERRLAGNGRVFVRYSGTEPLLRIMVEAAEDARAGDRRGDRRARPQAPRRR